MSYVGRVSNPSGLTMEKQRGPSYSMEITEKKSEKNSEPKLRENEFLKTPEIRHKEHR